MYSQPMSWLVSLNSSQDILDHTTVCGFCLPALSNKLQFCDFQVLEHDNMESQTGIEIKTEPKDDEDYRSSPESYAVTSHLIFQFCTNYI